MESIQEFLSYNWLKIGEFTFSIQQSLLLISVWLLTWLLLWLIKRQLKPSKTIFKIDLGADRKKLILRFFRILLYSISFLISLQLFGLPLAEVLNYTLVSREDDQAIRTINLVSIGVTIILARIGMLYFHKWFVNMGKTARIPLDQGRRLAIYQIVKYAIIVVVILLCLTFLKVNLSVLWVGTTGLLVVIGLALQQTFNDFFSGIIILFEGTIEIGDMVHIHSLDLHGEVIEIRLRSTVIETLDSTNVIVPNGRITAVNVVNWNYNDRETRFRLAVGVAYGSNVQLVRKILRSCASSHGLVLRNPEPRVRFKDFGESSLDFELLFWTDRTEAFEDIKSDLRFKIEAEFRRNKIEIPFPQRDLHIKSDIRWKDVPETEPNISKSSPPAEEKQEK